ncbi:MAG: SUF system NifU family Fe-S cluster assembly protein [Bacilli bacterium]|nr:SUF system NifU family Fe-S cluster assembly protein [Bacilli bacterium]
MDQNIKREIILDHYKNPINKGLINDESYLKVNMNNESCIDEIDLMVKVENNKIVDIKFDGEACAISTSATSIMIETLIGKTVDEVEKIYNEYTKMLDNKEYDAQILENAIVYDDISKQPNRIKCALLPWWGIEKILKKIKKY